MDIPSMNIKITFQKNTVTPDSIGNHLLTWNDYYSCHAAVSGENRTGSGSESENAGMVTEHPNTDFTVRYCEKVKEITADGYRIVFGDEVYNITGIDHMQYRHRAYKFRCRKERTKNAGQNSNRSDG